MKRILICLLSATSSGCATVSMPVVGEALKCEVPAGMLVACDDPVVIKPGITFGELITVSSQDRDKLRDCAHRENGLADAFAECNRKIDAFNSEMRDINARNAATR